MLTLVPFNRGAFVPRHLSTKLAKYMVRVLTRNCFDSEITNTLESCVSLFFFSIFFFSPFSSLELTRKRRSVRFFCRSFVIKINLNPSLSCTYKDDQIRGINPLLSKNIFLEGHPVIKIRNFFRIVSILSLCFEIKIKLRL